MAERNKSGKKLCMGNPSDDRYDRMRSRFHTEAAESASEAELMIRRLVAD